MTWPSSTPSVSWPNPAGMAARSTPTRSSRRPCTRRLLTAVRSHVRRHDRRTWLLTAVNNRRVQGRRDDRVGVDRAAMPAGFGQLTLGVDDGQVIVGWLGLHAVAPRVSKVDQAPLPNRSRKGCRYSESGLSCADAIAQSSSRT